MKKSLALLCALFCLLLTARMGYAASFDITEQLTGYLEEGPAAELPGLIPDAAQELLEGDGIAGTVEKLSPKALLSAALSSIKSSVTAPLRLLVSLVGIILICAILNSFSSSSSNSLEAVFYIIVSVFISAIIIDPVVSCIVEAVSTIRDFAIFILTFIPIFAGVTTASGRPMTGAAYNMLLFGMCQAASQIIIRFLVPMLSAYLALSIVSVVCPKMKLGRLLSGIKTFVTWSLNLILTVFVGLLTIQSVVASGGDTLANKTAKFFIGSLIPVVGGALSDIFSAAQGCVTLVRNTLGIFGIIVTALTFLPILVKTVIWYITVQAGSAISDMFQVKEVTGLLQAVSNTLGILMGVLLYYALLVIISTTLLIVMFQGG